MAVTLASHVLAVTLAVASLISIIIHNSRKRRRSATFVAEHITNDS